MEFRVRAQGFGFRVQGQGSGFRVLGLEFSVRVQGSEFRVQGETTRAVGPTMEVGSPVTVIMAPSDHEG